MTVSKRIPIDQLGAHLRRLGPELISRAKRGLRDAANVVIAQVQHEIETTTPHKPVDTGAYAAAWKKRNTSKGAVVGNSTPQAAWIERGRRKAPVSEEGMRHLEEWVRRKRLYLDAMPAARASLRAARAPGDSTRIKKKDAIAEACRRVAFLIARKLREEGYSPRFPLARAIKSSRPGVRAAIERAVKGR